MSVNVSGMLSVSGPGGTPIFETGVAADAESGSSGNAGKFAVTTGTLSLVNNGAILSLALGSGNGGSVSVAVAGQLSIDAALGDPTYLTGISSTTRGGRDAGTVNVTAGTLSIASNGGITSSTFASGNGGSVSVMVGGQLTIDGAWAIRTF